MGSESVVFSAVEMTRQYCTSSQINLNSYKTQINPASLFYSEEARPTCLMSQWQNVKHDLNIIVFFKSLFLARLDYFNLVYLAMLIVQ